MITIIFGPDGSGKSLWQMHIIERELVDTPRNIVTNLAIKVPEFCAWMEKQYPDISLNILDRLFVMNPDQAREFWKFRGPPLWSGKTGSEYETEYNPGSMGVAYVIDEAGSLGFDAMGWAQMHGKSWRGEQFMQYIDQQRKF